MRLSVAAFFGAVLLAGPVLAQPYGDQLPPDASPGIPSDRAVNPAPGATRPYLGHPGTFYDPVQRLRELDARAASLPPREARAMRAELRRIHAFAETQRARHGGDLRDWDRERMTRMMNELASAHPGLRG